MNQYSFLTILFTLIFLVHCAIKPVANASGSATATRVYGQAGSFTIGTLNNERITTNSMTQPLALVADSTGEEYISDVSNNRALMYWWRQNYHPRRVDDTTSFSSRANDVAKMVLF